MEVCWSPNHEDKFYLFGANLTLYRISEVLNGAPVKKDVTVISTSDTTSASLICTKTDSQFKCIAWRPDSNPDHLLAFGLNSGKVVLSSFGKGGSVDSNNLIGKEFSLRHPRACIQLEWNPYETHLLAEVTERHKSDPCIVLWDVRFSGQSASVSSVSSLHAVDRKQSVFHGLADSPSSSSRPILEIGMNDSCSSMAWFSTTPRTFICGMNGKYLRIYDIRVPADSSKHQSSVVTRSVHSLTIDKLSQHRVASFSENQLYIWDTRRFTEPVSVVQDKLNYSRIMWCPTRSGLLACSHQESNTLKLFDFYMSSFSNENGESVPVERYLKPSSVFSTSTPSDDVISSFAWHPTQRYRLLSVTPSGSVSDFYACDRLPVAWSPDLNLTFAQGTSFNICTSTKLCRGVREDVSIKMRKRACHGYGIQTKLSNNLPFVVEDDDLYKLWTWMSSVKPEHKIAEAKNWAFSEPFFPGTQGGSFSITPQTLRTSSTRLSMDVNSHPNPQMPAASLPISPMAPQTSLHQNGYQQQQQQHGWGSASHPSVIASNTMLSPSEPSIAWSTSSASVFSHPLAGVMSIFPKPSQFAKQAIASEMVAFDWLMTTPSNASPPTNPIRHRVQVYKSPQRERAIELCGWEFGHDSLSMSLIDKLESQHEYVRAAALSIFTVRMMRAIELLIKGAKNKTSNDTNDMPEPKGDLNMVAMALSGYTGKEGGLWTSMCSELTTTLENPYLKALFQFLTSEDLGYEAIVNDSGLELSDRVAFACLHLQDKKLISFLERQSNKYVEEGDPQGLLLTGLTESGVQLLSNYVDSTGDVQSAVAIAIQGQPELDLSKNMRVVEWIEAYRNLLDNMRLWTERAKFDVFYRKFDKVAETFRQTHLSCTYCSKAIVTDPKITRSKGNVNVGTHMKPRIQSCPHCRKPLARCAICMLYMGTASGIGCPKSAKANLNKDRKLSRISEWFTWCQTCLHGGHVDHMIDWFKTRSQCPVSGCKCKCDQLDAVSKVESGTSGMTDDSVFTDVTAIARGIDSLATTAASQST